MITGRDYIQSLRDGRRVWLDGGRVGDVTDHVLLRKSVDWLASTYDRYEGRPNPAFAAPTTAAELRDQIEHLVTGDRSMISTASCTTALRAHPHPAYRERAGAQIDDAVRRDIRWTSACEDTAKRVRVVGRGPDGIVVSGGKHHVLGAAVVHELLVLPAGPVDDPKEAVAFTVPVHSPGVRMVASTPAPRAADDRHYPLSRRQTISEAMVIFDDVLVPHDRVLLDGEVEAASSLRATLDETELTAAVAAQADRAELLLGLAQSIAEMNGTRAVAHIRDKLAAIAVYAKMCRAGWEAAITGTTPDESGQLRADLSYLYATKSYGTRSYSDMTYFLHDIAGGAVITAPTIADLDNPLIGDFCRKYMRTGENVSGEERIRIFHAIRDLTADTFGGWDKVTGQAVGGNMHAQRLAALELSDLAAARNRARAEAGITN